MERPKLQSAISLGAEISHLLSPSRSELPSPNPSGLKFQPYRFRLPPPNFVPLRLFPWLPAASLYHFPGPLGEAAHSATTNFTLTA